MPEDTSDYDLYVEHPRFGRSPRITGLDPMAQPGRPFWIFPPESKIPNTAIMADTERQTVTSFPIRYYFDQKRTCQDCQRPFIWFAEEQKHWIEDLGFYLNTDCVRCVLCRKQRQEVVALRKEYVRLFHAKHLNPQEESRLVELCIDLVEKAVLNKGRLEVLCRRLGLGDTPELHSQHRTNLQIKIRKTQKDS